MFIESVLFISHVHQNHCSHADHFCETEYCKSVCKYYDRKIIQSKCVKYSKPDTAIITSRYIIWRFFFWYLSVLLERTMAMVRTLSAVLSTLRAPAIDLSTGQRTGSCVLPMRHLCTKIYDFYCTKSKSSATSVRFIICTSRLCFPFLLFMPSLLVLWWYHLCSVYVCACALASESG